MIPASPQKIGVAEVSKFDRLENDLKSLAKNYSSLYTLLPPRGPNAGYPHLENWQDWLIQIDPGVSLKQIGQQIATLRTSEIAQAKLLCSPKQWKPQ